MTPMTPMTSYASIVIPFHNERESLEVLLPELVRAIDALDDDLEVILIDDVSTDGSDAIVERFQTRHPYLQLVRLSKRGGQTGAFQEAFRHALGRFIIRMDSDLQDNPLDLHLFVEKFKEGADVIMGIRECRKHSRALRFASGVYDLLVLLLTNSPMHSNSGSFCGFKADLVQDIPFRKNDHRYLPLIATHRGATTINEVFVRHRPRQFGESKYQPLRKVIFGIPEVLRFFVRLKCGVYDRRASLALP
jgi:glycosyltransferase involved in cell wall biosynthesis